MLGRARIVAFSLVTLAGAATVVIAACGVDVVGTADGDGPSTNPDGAPPTPPGTPQPVGDGAVPPTKDECGAIANRGPRMVRASDAGPDGGFCIDATEVTVGQFRAFQTALDAGGVELPFSEDAGCAAPTEANGGGGTDRHPVTMVSWCDAVTFCEWAGKRLCSGSLSGEWYDACSGGGVNAFPNAEGEAVCNAGAGRDPLPATQTVPAKDGGCEGAPAGVYDLVGNVSEWTSTCEGPNCETRGSTYATADVTCTTSYYYGKAVLVPDNGFRCCR